jgi:uncharacterized membrane protein (Fun14 family)
LILRGEGGLIGFGINYADHRKLKLNLALSGENKINIMFIRIPYYGCTENKYYGLQIL